MFTYAHVKWFYGQSERAYYLNYFIIDGSCASCAWVTNLDGKTRFRNLQHGPRKQDIYSTSRSR